jgi:predicted DCC family thiol-disulfide oxidoreductase YuxK
MMSNSNPVLLYDGVCGLCSRVVQFVLSHDQGGVVRFAALQSPFAARILRRHGLDPEVQNTLVVVLNLETPHEQLLFRSDGALYLLRTLRRPWPFIARLAIVLPPALRDLGYRMVAKYRYRIFGKHDTCPLPKPDVVSRFLDVDVSL